MSDDTRFDVAHDALIGSGLVADEQLAALIAREVVDALRAFDSKHASDRSLGVRRWDVMAHESRLRQQFERAVRAMPTAYYSGPVQDREAIYRDDVLRLLKGPISD